MSPGYANYRLSLAVVIFLYIVIFRDLFTSRAFNHYDQQIYHVDALKLHPQSSFPRYNRAVSFLQVENILIPLRFFLTRPDCLELSKGSS